MAIGHGLVDRQLFGACDAALYGQLLAPCSEIIVFAIVISEFLGALHTVYSSNNPNFTAVS
jgi:hypothetical protein